MIGRLVISENNINLCIKDQKIREIIGQQLISQALRDRPPVLKDEYMITLLIDKLSDFNTVKYVYEENRRLKEADEDIERK